MKLLLDTSAFLWASKGSPLLSPAASAAILDPANERFVSLASVWEMQVKHNLGKWPLPGPIDIQAPLWAQAIGASLLPIDLSHIGMLYRLPSAHRDPFDRILVAQAVGEGLTIVSPDRVFRAYPCPVLW